MSIYGSVLLTAIRWQIWLDAAQYIRGIGLQWEGKDIVADVHQKYPDMKLMQTENECGGGTFDWGAAEHTFDLLNTYLNGGVNSYMYWNMVLQDDGASSWGWRQNDTYRLTDETGHLYTGVLCDEAFEPFREERRSSAECIERK